jgi:hypothetical protein
MPVFNATRKITTERQIHPETAHSDAPYLRFRNCGGGSSPIEVVVGRKLEDHQWPEGGPAEGEWWNCGTLLEMAGGQALIHRPAFEGITPTRSRDEAAWAFKVSGKECMGRRFSTLGEARGWLALD